jgi:hypothetical protein
MNKPNGQKNLHKPDNQPSPSGPEDNAGVSSSHKETTDTKCEVSQQQGIWNGIKKTTSTDRITAFATVIIMIATTAYSIIALKQWNVMERQTDAAFQQLSTARSSIKIANDALKDARETGKEQSDRAERLTKANEDVAHVSIQSAETLKQSASKSLDATIENFRLEQRAWVNIKEMAFKGYTAGGNQVFIKEGHPIRFRATYTNTGKTPARILTTKTYMFAMKAGVTPPLQEKAIIATENQHFTLFPNGTYGSPEVVSDAYSTEQIEVLKSGQYILYIYGMIPYEDVFGQTRWTQYCYYLTTDFASFNVCTFYNDTDKTRKNK